MDPTRAADVDDHPRLLVLDTEVRRRGSDQPEGRRVVHGDHGVPLLVGHLSYPFDIWLSSCQLRGSPHQMQSKCAYVKNREWPTNLMDNPIPREPGVVHDDVDLPVAKLGRLLHQRLDVVGVLDVADHGDRAAGLGVVDRLGDGVGFLCSAGS